MVDLFGFMMDLFGFMMDLGWIYDGFMMDLWWIYDGFMMDLWWSRHVCWSKTPHELPLKKSSPGVKKRKAAEAQERSWARKKWLMGIAMERSTMLLIGKASISMAHLYHGYVRLC